MMVNNVDVLRRLRGIVYRLKGDAGLHDDLMQEALIHLWQMEAERPGRQQRWYLQGCRYHLQNYLRRGRSVDSTKHGRAQVPAPVLGAEDESHFEWPPHSNGAAWEEISAKDIIAVLCPQLKPEERATLRWLADGLSAREIADRLRLSHTFVNKLRRKIAFVASKLGIAPPSKRANGDRSTTRSD